MGQLLSHGLIFQWLFFTFSFVSNQMKLLQQNISMTIFFILEVNFLPVWRLDSLFCIHDT